MMSGQDCAKTLDGVKVNLLIENVEHEYANYSKNIYVISHQPPSRGVNASNWKNTKLIQYQART